MSTLLTKGVRKPKKWIAGATENAHGQFRAKAQRAGMSTLAYAEKEEHAKGRLGEEARLAETLIREGRHRRRR